MGQLLEGVGQLNFIMFPGLGLFQAFKNVGGQEVAADDGKVGRRFFRGRLFNQIIDFIQPVDRRPGINDPILLDIGLRDLLDSDQRGGGAVIDFHHLLERGNGVIDDVVPQENGEGLIIADQIFCAKDGMAQTARLALTDVAKVGHFGNFPEVLQEIFLAGVLEGLLQLERNVKMIFNGPLSTAGNNNDLLDSGSHRLLDDILNQRFVDQREHLFGRGFGHRKEAGSQTGGRDDRLCYLPCRHFFSRKNCFIVVKGINLSQENLYAGFAWSRR